MENEIVKILMKECNFKEKFVIIIFRKIIIKVYHISRINTFNIVIKK